MTLRAALFELPGGFIIGLTLISAVLLLLWVLGLYQVGWGHWRHWFFYFVFNSYVSAVLEELAFRAILLRLVARVFGPVTGLIISSLLFGLAHATYASFVASAQIAVVGLVFGALYMKSGKLWLAIYSLVPSNSRFTGANPRGKFQPHRREVTPDEYCRMASAGARVD